MLRSNFGQDKWSSCLWELMWVKWPKCFVHTASSTWMFMGETLGAQRENSTGTEKEGCTRKASFQRGHRENWTRVTHSPCVLLFCASGAVQELSCTKPGFSCCSTLLGSTSVTRDLVLALWKSICTRGRQGRSAMSMLINIIGAGISLAWQGGLTAPQSPVMLPKLDLYRTIIQKGSFFLKLAKPSCGFPVKQLFQGSSLKCTLSATTPVSSALKRSNQSLFFKVWQENDLPISPLECPDLENPSVTRAGW